MKTFARFLMIGLCAASFAALGCPGNGNTDASPGRVTLNVAFAGGTARSILPGAPVFAEWKYYFDTSPEVAVDGTHQKTPVDGTTFLLPPGAWYVRVEGYLAQGGALAASGTSAQFTVTEGQTTSGIFVALEIVDEVLAESGTGVFDWQVTFPEGVTIAAFTLGDTNLIAGTPPPSPTFSGTLNPHPAGFYPVSITLQDASGKEAGRNDIVHLYAGQTTRLDWAFTADDFKNLFSMPAVISAYSLYGYAVSLDEVSIDSDPLPGIYLSEGNLKVPAAYNGKTVTLTFTITKNTVEYSDVYEGVVLNAGVPLILENPAEAFLLAHSAILAKTTATVTANDAEALAAALNAWDALTDGGKTLSAAEKTLLDDLDARVQILTLPATITFAVNEQLDAFAGSDGNATYESTLTDAGSNAVTFGELNGHKVLTLGDNADYLSLPDIIGDYLQLDAWTIELYVRPASSGSNVDLFAFYNAAAGINHDPTLRLEQQSGANWLLMIYENNQNAGNNRVTFTKPAAGLWTHAAYVKSGRTITPYLNGVAVSDAETTSAWFNESYANVDTVRLGNLAGSAWYQFVIHNGAKEAAYFSGVQATVDALNTVTVTFNANGGKWVGDGNAETTTKTLIKPASTLGVNLPENPTKEGSPNYFVGWFPNDDGTGAQFTGETTITGDITVFAKWGDAPPTYTITFESMGGSAVAPAEEIEGGGTVGSLPTPPTLEGFTFAGWYTQPHGAGTVFDATTPVNASISVYAKWTWNDLASVTWAVNAGGDAFVGTPSSGSPFDASLITGTDQAFETTVSGTHKVLNAGLGSADLGPQAGAFLTGASWTIEAYTRAPNTGSGDRYLFSFAKTDAASGTNGGAGSIYSINRFRFQPDKTGGTYHDINYSDKGSTSFLLDDTYHHIAYVSNSGTMTVYVDGAVVSSQAPSNGGNLATLASNTSYDPLWSSRLSRKWDDTSQLQNVRFYQFTVSNTAKNIASDAGTIAATLTALNTTYTVTFNPDGGNWDADQTPKVLPALLPNSKVAALPPDPAKDALNFGGWFTQQEGAGDPFTANTVVTGPLVVYAMWTSALPRYTVTFDSMGGSTEEAITDIESGSTISELPTPTLTGFTFAGWYSERCGGGTQLTTSTPVTGNMTVLANWTWANSIATLTYAVNEDGTAFVGTPSSGEPFNATLGGAAAIQTEATSHKVVTPVNSSGYIELGPQAGAFLNGSAWTLEFYIYVPTSGSTNDRMIFSFQKDAAPATANGAVFSQAHLTRFNYRILTESATTNNGGAGSLQDGTWHHLAYHRDGNAVRAYLDGVLKNSGNSSSFSALYGNAAYTPLWYNYLGQRYDFDSTKALSDAKYYKVIVSNTNKDIQNDATIATTLAALNGN